MQFKKIAAITGSALLAGLTLTAPVLASTVTEIGKISDIVSVTDSTVSFPMFVIGSTAATADVAGAVGVGVRLAAESKTTSTVTVEGAAVETVTGGSKLATTGIALTPWINPQTVKGIFTTSDIPELLGTDSFMTVGGGTYQYKQYLYIGGETTNANSPKLKFERPTAENTPRMALKLTGSQTAWTYKMAFSTPVAIGSGVDTTTEIQAILQGQTINMLGKDFVISDCTGDGTNPIATLTLLGGKNVVTVDNEESKTVTVDGEDYTITLSSVAAETVGTATYYTAIGDINGESYSLRAGQSTVLSDGILVAAIKVFQGKTGAADYLRIAIGAKKVKITNAAGTIAVGDVTKPELSATITDSTTAGWSAMTITYTPQVDNWLEVGGSVEDLFSEGFDLKFNSIYPAFDDAVNRETITITPSAYNLLVKYTNAVDVEDEMFTLYYDSATWRWASAVSLGVSNALNNIRDIVYDEATNISAYEQDYFVIQRAGFSHLMQFTSFSPASSEMTFTDEAGNSLTTSNTSATDADLIVDGNTYAVRITNSSGRLIQVDLNGDGYIGGITKTGYITNATAGAEYSYLVPKMITSGQGGLYFYDGNKSGTLAGAWAYPAIGFGGIRLHNDSISNIVVGYYTTTPGAWLNFSTNITHTTGTVSQTYVLPATAASGGYIDIVVNISNTTANQNFYNVALGAAAGTMRTAKGFILVEEALQGGTTHDWIYFPVAWDNTNTRTYITTSRSDDSNYAETAVLGTSTEYNAMSSYGTLVDRLSTTLGGSATISYPDTFLYGNVYILAPDGTITTGEEAGEVETETVLPITADIVMLDSEISETQKTTNDLILVGGPCINTLVAELATAGDFPYGCADWPGRDFGRIQLISDAFGEGYTALVVAGTRAADTDLAARIVQVGLTGATDEQKAGSHIEVTGTVSSPAYST